MMQIDHKTQALSSIAQSMARRILAWMQENGSSFTEETARYLDATYSISSRMRDHIPHEGRVILWSSARALSTEYLLLVHLLQELRDDVAVLSDDPLIAFLQEYENAPFPVYHTYSDEDLFERLQAELNRECALILSAPDELAESKQAWAEKCIALAQKMECPILPVHFELPSASKKKIIFTETPVQNGLEIRINTGELIPPSSFVSLKPEVAAGLVLTHEQAFREGRSGVLRTISNVVPPSDRRKLRKEILRGETLGFTEDNKVILLFEHDSARAVMQEIARLRELTFRKIGEGTGLRRDTDRFDRHYHHLLLWDDEEMEIVGAYRLGLCKQILREHGIEGLYSNSLFAYEGKSRSRLEDAVECGRSFVQEKYWNSLALDYLWHGIGAFIAKRPEIKYLYGPVSISQSYSKDARDHLIYFYTLWFRPEVRDIRSRNPYRISDLTEARLCEYYPGKNYKTEFRTLKKNLKMMGFAVPTLYKQYTELCETGGVQFFDFGVDPNFSNCIDGLIWVHISRITQKKQDRYINNKEHSIQYAPSFLSLAEKISVSQKS